MALRPSHCFSAVLVALAPAVTGAQGIVIEHKEANCFVAERYPKLDACFEPAAAVARARVFFHGDLQSNWFFVDMTPGKPCFTALLPKPSRRLKKVSYYVEVMDASFGSARSLVYEPIVVKNKKECPTPYLDKALVKVGGAGLPLGFAAGAGGSGLVTAVVLGGAAAVAGGVIAGTGGGQEAATTTIAPQGTHPPSSSASTTTPPSTSPATTTPGTLPGSTTTTLPGTTTTTTTLPTSSTTTSLPGTTTTLPGTTTTTSVPTSSTTTTTTSSTTTTTTTVPGCSDTTPPQTSITSPAEGYTCILISCSSITIRATASDNVHVQEVRFFVDGGQIATDTSPPYSAVWNTGLSVGQHTLTTTAIDECGNEGNSAPVHVTIISLSPPTAHWTSVLDVPEAAGQVVFNGTSLVFVKRGRSDLTGELRPGENRFEAQLVQADGPGTWRFELGELEKGSLRAVAGDVALITQNAIVFRVRGRPGERVVFTFRTPR